MKIAQFHFNQYKKKWLCLKFPGELNRKAGGMPIRQNSLSVTVTDTLNGHD